MMSQPERKVYALPYVPKVMQTEESIAAALRRVCGYARVSTNEEEQQNSYEKQIEYYTDYIQSHDGWKFCGMYTDVNISYGQKPNHP